MSAVVGRHERLARMSGGWDTGLSALILQSSGLPVGKHRMLSTMRDLGWLYLHPSSPTPEAVQAGYLLPGRPVTVTGRGLIELWRVLGGVAEIQVIQVEVMAA